MGYDITFHPISEEQMDAWYFSLLDSLAKGDTSRLWRRWRKTRGWIRFT